MDEGRLTGRSGETRLYLVLFAVCIFVCFFLSCLRCLYIFLLCTVKQKYREVLENRKKTKFKSSNDVLATRINLSTVLATNVCKEFGVSYCMNIDAASHDTNPIIGIKKKRQV